MFALQLAAVGCVLPLFSIYLIEDLGLSGTQAGIIQASSSLSVLVGPIYGAVIADRLLAARHLLAACAAAAAAALIVLHEVHGFGLALIAYLGYTCAFAPTVGLANGLAFQYLQGQRASYGGIRVWGNVGALVAAWAVGGWLLLRPATQGGVGDALLIAAGLFLLLVPVACSLPAPPLQPRLQRRLVPVEALRAWRIPAVRWTAIWYACNGAAFVFYFLGAGPFLRAHGVPGGWILMVMACSALTGIPAMATLGRMLERLGHRRVMALGGAVMVVQLAVFLIDPGLWALPIAIAGTGMMFAWFRTGAICVIDAQVPIDARAGVHQLLGLLSPGLSVIVGGLTAGALLDLVPAYGFGPFWAVALALAIIAAVGAWITTPDRA